MARPTNSAIPFVIALVTVVLLLAGYMATYYGLLADDPVEVTFADTGETTLCFVSPPTYRAGGPTARAIFYPAHLVERHIVRPRQWVSFH